MTWHPKKFFGSFRSHPAVTRTASRVATYILLKGITTVGVGETTTIIAHVYDQFGREIHPRPVLTWVSSNTSIVTVTNSGVVRGVAPGSAFVTSSKAGTTSTLLIGVVATDTVPVPPMLTTVTLTPASITVGTIATAVAFDQYSVILTANVSWSSGTPSIATVDANGVVTPVSAGTTAITAMYQTVGVSATLTVTAVPAATVLVLPVAGATITPTFTAKLTFAPAVGPLAVSFELRTTLGALVQAWPFTVTAGTVSLTKGLQITSPANGTYDVVGIVSAVETAPHQITLTVQAPVAGVLSADDFTYLGYYDVQVNASNSPFAQGLTHRYVNGQLRFLSIEHGIPTAWVFEWTVDGLSFGQSAVKTNQWLNPWNNGQELNGHLMALWWDEPNERLWSTHALDYTYTTYQTNIYTRTLNANGTISDLHGPVGLQGISAKRTFGGALELPAYFQSAYGVGKYAVGFGGYTSLAAGGGTCSFGPTFYALPDPDGYTNDTEIPSGQFTTVMDCSSGVRFDDWYAAGTPTSFDRGVRLNIPTNYFDNGDLRDNPTTPPPGPPVPSAGWLSPAPDGMSRWVWGDSYLNTGCWIEGLAKHGYVAVASLLAGNCWYGHAQLQSDGKVFEAHVYDPTNLGEAVLATRAVWNVKPVARVPLTLPGLGTIERGGLGVVGATYDETTKTLYLYGVGGGGTQVNRLYVFSVDA